MNKCLNCGNELIETIVYIKKLYFFHYKVYVLFCGCCDYEKRKLIKISKQDFLNSLNNRTIETTNTKILRTEKTYNQKYQNVLNPLIKVTKEGLK